jgi:Protein of unknown function (DUF4236)
MGFSFRKSLKFGPLRVNLSKSGVGVSAGVKGARVSVGPKGTYLNAGLKGVNYRQRLHPSRPDAPIQKPAPLTTAAPKAPLTDGHGIPRIYVTLGVAILVVLTAAVLLAFWLVVNN